MTGGWGSGVYKITSSSIAIKHKQEEHIICQLLMWKSLWMLAWHKQKIKPVILCQICSSYKQIASPVYEWVLFTRFNHHFMDEESSDADKPISLLKNQHHSHVVFYQQNNWIPTKSLFQESRWSQPMHCKVKINRKSTKWIITLQKTRCLVYVVDSNFNNWCGLGYCNGKKIILAISICGKNWLHNGSQYVVTGCGNGGKSSTVLHTYLPNQRMCPLDISDSHSCTAWTRYEANSDDQYRWQLTRNSSAGQSILPFSPRFSGNDVEDGIL